SPDDLIDTLARRSCSDWGIGRTLWMLLRELIDKVGDRPRDGAPIRRGGVAGDADRFLHRAQTSFLAQLRQPGAPEHHAEHRVGNGGLVESAQVLIAAPAPSQQRITDIEER